VASPGLMETRLTPLSKVVTEERIALFEEVGIFQGQGANIHTDSDLAARRLGTPYAIASGRMSLAYAAEALRRYFGADTFHHTGTLNLKFLRPVKPGDTLSVAGRVSGREDEAGGTRVFVDVWCENQRGERTAAGMGSALLG